MKLVEPGGDRRQGLGGEGRVVEERHHAAPGRGGDHAEARHHRVVLEPPAQVDSLDAVEPKRDGLAGAWRGRALKSTNPSEDGREAVLRP